MLSVYRASAGSGKTHLLSGEYLRLLFSPEGTTTFDNILAVTFTNKATEEMKSRILWDLYVLAVAPHKSDYAAKLMEYTSLPIGKIRARAAELLPHILHNYGDYNVSTIDRFFQQVTRAFSREIGLQGGYEVSLDGKSMVSEAVDRLIANLDKANQKELLRWLERYIISLVDEGQDWALDRSLKSLGEETLKESYRANAERLAEVAGDKEKMKAFVDQINDIAKHFEDALQEVGEKAVSAIERSGLELANFTRGEKGAMLHFYKWKVRDKERLEKGCTSTFIELAESPSEKWAASSKVSKATKQAIIALVDSTLRDLHSQALTIYRDYHPLYLSAKAASRYLYQVGILSDIGQSLNELTLERNVRLISDTTELLRRVIDGAESPFIYEKTGAYLKHYMIDEFQDTSRMQWSNFKPLIEDSLGEDNANLIVGDVKQSIYRWRDSDWNLLQSQIKHDFGSQKMREETLGTNWRSLPNVIAFNNAFFAAAAIVVQEDYNSYIPDTDASPRSMHRNYNVIRDVYSDVCQKISDRKKDSSGRVRVELIEEKRWKAVALTRLTESLRELQDKGYRLSDIAILVRQGTEGQTVANHLLAEKAKNTDSRYRYDIISSDSLYVGQSKTVQTVLAIMRYLASATSKVDKLVATYQLGMQLQGLSPEEALKAYFDWSNGASPASGATSGAATGDFPIAELNDEIEQLRALSLYELTERLLKLVAGNAPKGEVAYIEALQDLVVAFIQQNAGADLSAFLHWWEESGNGKTISTPEGMDAIQIMTIHKSKGLEFKAVIVPFADWDFNGIRNGMRENIIWIEPKIPPFDQIPLLPLKYSSTLSKTLFFEEYLQERVETTVDNLNLAYVAFTRAEEELIIFAPKEAEKEEKKSKGSDRTEKYRFMGHLLADVLLADGGVDAVERKEGYEYAEFAGNRGMETRSFVLDDTAESADDASGASEDDDAEGGTDRTDVKIHYFEIGADWVPTAKAEKPRSGNTCFVKVGDTMDEDEKPEKATAELVDLNSFASEDYTSRLQQRLNSKGFFEENANRALGTKMHEVLASIATTADVDRAVAQSVRKGILTVDERDAVAAELKRLLASDPLISSWYAPEARVVNEMNILFPSDTSKSALRPDRIIFYEGGRRVVVVDYKFGDRTRKAYVAQVKEYIDAIKAMGYEQVEGYLWYVEREEIVRV